MLCAEHGITHLNTISTQFSLHEGPYLQVVITQIKLNRCAVFQIKFCSNTAATLFSYLNPQPVWLTLKFLVLRYFCIKKGKKKKRTTKRILADILSIQIIKMDPFQKRKRIKDMSEKQSVQQDCKPYLFTIV